MIDCETITASLPPLWSPDSGLGAEEKRQKTLSRLGKKEVQNYVGHAATHKTGDTPILGGGGNGSAIPLRSDVMYHGSTVHTAQKRKDGKHGAEAYALLYLPFLYTSLFVSNTQECLASVMGILLLLPR